MRNHNEGRRKHTHPAVLIDPEPLIDFLMSVSTRDSRPIYASFTRWRQKGGVDIFIADRHCIRNGVHPSEVYGDLWWEMALADADLVAS
jgi:hypothetical protein